MKRLVVILFTAVAVFFNTAMGQYDHERRYNLDQIFFNNDFEKEVVIDFLEGKKQDKLELLLAAGQKISREEAIQYKKEFNHFIDQLKSKRKRYRNDHKFLEYVFFKVHKKYLRHYENYVTVDKLFEKKYYDCVVGSGFYALVLDEMGIAYNIIETNYHMFIMLERNNRMYLIESTDPVDGFVYGNEDVLSRLDRIKQREKQIEKENFSTSTYTYNYTIQKDINLQQLVGLQYFNLATIAFNQYHFDEAINNVQKARLFYDSQRMKGMMKLIVNAYQNVEVKNTK